MTKYVTLQKQVDRQLIDLLETASRQSEERITALAGRDNISSIVGRLQMASARAEIQALIATLWDAVGVVARSGQKSAAQLASEVSFAWDQVLVRQAFPEKATRDAMRASLIQTASRNVEAAIARMNRSAVPLSARVYLSRQGTMDLVDRRINTALLRGVTVKQFAGEVRDLIRPGTPGGVSYAALRLARTEINNAYHAVTAQQNRDKPWNTGMAWATSGSHPKPDLCNLYEDRSPYQLHDVPAKPHPNCLCYIYPITVEPDEFLRAFRRGEYDSYIATNYGRTTYRAA